MPWRVTLYVPGVVGIPKNSPALLEGTDIPLGVEAKKQVVLEHSSACPEEKANPIPAGKFPLYFPHFIRH